MTYGMRTSAQAHEGGFPPPSPRSGEAGGRSPTDGVWKSRNASSKVRSYGRASLPASRQRAIPHPALPIELGKDARLSVMCESLRSMTAPRPGHRPGPTPAPKLDGFSRSGEDFCAFEFVPRLSALLLPADGRPSRQRAPSPTKMGKREKRRQRAYSRLVRHEPRAAGSAWAGTLRLRRRGLWGGAGC